MTMRVIDRRQFLRSSALRLSAFAAIVPYPADLLGNPLGLPIGLELYTVRGECQKDLEGTLKKVAAIGYKEVEVFDFYGKSASQFRRLLEESGLTAPSAHYKFVQVQSGWEEHVEFARALGLKYMVNAILEPDQRKSLDDYKRAAELFNKAGEQCKKRGIQFAYHNHNFEFKTFDGVVAYDELLRLTDPKLVQMEMDCYWVTRAGKDPVEYFKKHPGRFPLLHIKDRKPGYPPATDQDKGRGPFTEVGRGSINWKRIFAAAPQGGVKHYYVEQDFCDGSPLQSIWISYDYLKNLKV